MKTIKEVKQYVQENQPFAYDELKHMNANIGSITMKLAKKLGINPEGGSGNINECAIADMLYAQYMAEIAPEETTGEAVPTSKFSLDQTVYYLSGESIITSKVKSIHYRVSTNPNYYQSGFTYWGEFGQLPDKTFATKSELVLDLIAQTDESVAGVLLF